MLSDVIKVSVGGMEIEITKGTTLLEISKMFNKEGRPAVIAKVGNHFVELNEVALPGSKIEFCDVTHYYANRVYASGLIFLINYAFNEIFRGKNTIIVKHSADRSICIETTKPITKEDIKKVEDKMKSIVDANLPITKVTVLKKEAIDYFTKNHDMSKVKLLKFYLTLLNFM